MVSYFELVVLFGTIVGTALLARFTQLPITALEIVAGVVLVAAFAFQLPSGVNEFVVLGSLLIVFLAGFETDFRFLRRHLRTAMTIGLGGFLLPFTGLALLLYYGLHAPLLVTIVGATALADTSISIVYTTLQQYELSNLPFGRLILAATLSVNLLEDVTITTTTFLSAPGFLFTLGVLGALLLAAILLPRFAKAVESSPKGSFTNLDTRALLFSLAILATLSALVGVPGILFVFLMGLIFSLYGNVAFLQEARRFAFALFVPLYFLAVGLRVDLGFVYAHLPVLLLLLGAATALKVAAIFPAARRYLGPARAGPVAVLMNARLTSATVILLLTLTLGLIPVGWYSVFISVVVILALSSALALRAFPAFASPEAAVEAFKSEGPYGTDLSAPLSRPSMVRLEGRP